MNNTRHPPNSTGLPPLTTIDYTGFNSKKQMSYIFFKDKDSLALPSEMRDVLDTSAKNKCTTQVEQLKKETSLLEDYKHKWGTLHSQNVELNKQASNLTQGCKQLEQQNSILEIAKQNLTHSNQELVLNKEQLQKEETLVKNQLQQTLQELNDLEKEFLLEGENYKKSLEMNLFTIQTLENEKELLKEQNAQHLKKLEETLEEQIRKEEESISLLELELKNLREEDSDSSSFDSEN